MSIWNRIVPERSSSTCEAAVQHATVMSLEDFRQLTNHVNAECGGIGCGYSRRRCRQEEVVNWIRRWVDQDEQRVRFRRALREALSHHLPPYYTSMEDRAGDGNAFSKLYADVMEAVLARSG